jgi:hypothetical protein
VKTGAKEVGKMVRRGPETVIERVQSQRSGRRERGRERDREKEISDEMFSASPLEIGEPLTTVTTRDSDFSTYLKMTPPSKTSISCCKNVLISVSRVHTDEFTETPRSSVSEPMYSPRIIREDPDPTSVPLSIDRPKSACDELLKEHHDAWYPRRLSFSIAQDAIETWYDNLRVI